GFHPSIAPPLGLARVVVLAVFRIGNEGTFAPEPLERGPQMEVALATARRAKERQMRRAVFTIDGLPYLPDDDPVLRREACMCHLAWCCPSSTPVGREVKGPPTPEEIGHKHDGHAPADNQETERGMVLSPLAEVLQKVKGGHGILLEPKSRQRPDADGTGTGAERGGASTAAGDGSGRRSSYICAYVAIGGPATGAEAA